MYLTLVRLPEPFDVYRINKSVLVARIKQRSLLKSHGPNTALTRMTTRTHVLNVFQLGFQVIKHFGESIINSSAFEARIKHSPTEGSQNQVEPSKAAGSAAA